MVRTRSAAATLAESGHVRVNGERVGAASRLVRAGDVVTLALDRSVRVLKVLGFAEQRGPFERARMLYEDVGPRSAGTGGPQEPGGPERSPGISGSAPNGSHGEP
jgi:ribosome-associated heat shock protein Hsp15